MQSHVYCIEGMQYKLKTLISALKRSVTLTEEDSYAPIATMINVINGRIPIPVWLERILNEILVFSNRLVES